MKKLIGLALLSGVAAAAFLLIVSFIVDNDDALSLPTGELTCGNFQVPPADGVEVATFPLPRDMAEQVGVNAFVVLRTTYESRGALEQSFITFNPVTGDIVSQDFKDVADEAKLTTAFAAKASVPPVIADPAWPRTKGSLNSERKFIEVGNVKVPNPEQGSGLMLSLIGETLEVLSCTSRVSIDTEDGSVIESSLDPDEKVIFDRLLSECRGC